jgi:hypothetical protein
MGDVVNLCEGDEMVLQNFFVCLGVHCGVFRQKIEAPHNQYRKAAPDNDGIWMFKSFHHQLDSVMF